MRTMLKAMKHKKYGIPDDVVLMLEIISRKYEEPGIPYFKPEWDDDFSKALVEHLTTEQRLHLYETQGGCNGAGADKERKAFAIEYAHLPLNERMALFSKTFSRRMPVLNADNTLTLTFKCSHGYYLRAKKRMYTTPPPNVEGYFERCAGGRLYELEKALGIKLKIKSVDVTPLGEDLNNPVVFTYEIV